MATGRRAHRVPRPARRRDRRCVHRQRRRNERAQLPIDTTRSVDFEGLGWSPDGKHLELHERRQTTVGCGGLADQHRRHRRRRHADRTASSESSNGLDGRAPAKLVAGQQPIGVPVREGFPCARSGSSTRTDRVSGWWDLETFESTILGHTWAPDGKTLLITEFPENEARREASGGSGRSTWRLARRRRCRFPSQPGSAWRPDRVTSDTVKPGHPARAPPYPRSSSGRTSFARRVCDSSS